MPHDILLIIILVIPIAVLTFLRVNAVLVFLSLCLGEVLVTYVAGNANSFVSLALPNISPTVLSFLQVGLLLLPVVLTTVFMIRTIHSRGRLIMNLLPAAGVGLLGVLLAVPLLPTAQRNQIEAQTLWAQLTRMQTLIVGASAVIGLFFLWAQRRRMEKE